MTSDTTVNPCFQCATAVTSAQQLHGCIDGQAQVFCSEGCRGIALVIENAGLAAYYRRRDSYGASAQQQEDFSKYNNPRLQKGWVTQSDNANDGIYHGQLLISGIHCAACIWLIENWLQRLQGVVACEVNYSNHRLALSWDANRIAVSEIMNKAQAIGYQLSPYSEQAELQRDSEQRQQLLKRLGVAAALTMQIMVLSVALYTGDYFGISESTAAFFKRINLLLCLPLLGYCAQPFFRGAWLGLRNRRWGMDLPVSIALLLAMAGSVYATVTEHGDVYFDSVAMFVFFLLGARFIELSQRVKGAQRVAHQAQSLPQMANVLLSKPSNLGNQSEPDSGPASVNGAQPQVTSVSDSASVKTALNPDHLLTAQTTQCLVEDLTGDELIRVAMGEAVPVDGLIVAGASEFNEAWLTGEAQPQARGLGDMVYAGALNQAQPVIVRMTRQPEQFMMSAVLRLAQQASANKSQLRSLTERLSAFLVVGVLLLAAAVAIFGLAMDSPNWLATTIAVLVVTCPCALSLATPLALSVATNRLRQMGVYLVSEHALQTLPAISHYMLDKTGTLTQGKLSLERVELQQDIDEARVITLAANLQQGLMHPIARAMERLPGQHKALPVSQWQYHAGLGVSGHIDSKQYYLGSWAFIQKQLGDEKFRTENPLKYGSARHNHPANELDDNQANQQTHNAPRHSVGDNDGLLSLAVLADANGVLAIFYFTDQVRLGAAAFVRDLQPRQSVSLVSGDRDDAVQNVAQRLGIANAYGDCLPEQKLARVEQAVAKGEVVAMIGDGLNDTPALGKAHLAITLAENVNLTSSQSDIIMTTGDLNALIGARRMATRCQRIIKQNLGWALFYNISAIPLTVLGFVPPWLAAIGMSLSSLLVVVNSNRLSRFTPATANR